MVAQLGLQFREKTDPNLTVDLVCLDSALSDLHFLIQGIKPDYQILLLHPQANPIQQITEYLANQPVASLHIVCHGAPGCLYLGKTVLHRGNLSDHRHPLQQWQVPRIHIWACAVGQDRQFLRQLADLTEAEVVASDGLIGNLARGGSWELGCRVGSSLSARATVPIPFTPECQQSYSDTLVAFSSAPSLTTDNAPFAMTTGDFDDDGNLDLAIANSSDNNINIFLGDGAGNFNPTSFSPATGSNPQFISVGDFDNDGNLDLVTVNQNDETVTLFLGDGAGNFSLGTVFAVGSQPTSLVVADFDGNGNTDLAVANKGDNNITILLGDGAGNFMATGPSPVVLGVVALTAGNFNGDARLDLATANGFANSVTILLGDGFGNFSPFSNIILGGGLIGPAAIAMGNFNQDSHLDLVTANFDDDSVTVLLGNGAGNFDPAFTFATGNGTWSVKVADFNGDNHLDLVTANYGVNEATLLLGDGTGFFTSQSIPLTNPFSRGLVIADFNGDRKPDFAISNVNKNRVDVFLNTTSRASIFPGTNPQEQGNTPGTFTFKVDTPANIPLTLDFQVAGTAQTPDDYTFLVTDPNIIASTGTSITLDIGVTEVTLSVIPVDDTIIDPNETIDLTLLVSSNVTSAFFIDPLASAASLLIIDNDQPIANVSTLSNPAENGPTAGQILFTLNQSTPSPTTLFYTVNGNADPGLDYIPLPGNVVVPGGETSVTVAVVPVDDDIADPDETIIITLGEDGSYTPGTNSTTTLIIFDNNTAGFTLNPTIPLTTTEAGATAQPTLRLNSQPLDPVIISLSSSDPTEGIVNPTTLTFTPENWSVPQTITITGQDDLIADGNIPYQITGTASSSDSLYNNLAIPVINVTNLDNDTAGITLTQTQGFTEVTEGNNTPDTYTIALNTDPSDPVDITITADEQLEISQDGINFSNSFNLTFTDTNPQTISVLAIDDTLIEGLHTGEITHVITTDSDPNYNSSFAINPLTVSIIDNDLPPVPAPTPTPSETPNLPPVAIPDTATTLINTPVSIPVLANDFDSDFGDILNIQSFDLITAKGGTIILQDQGNFDPSDDRLLYTPPTNFIGVDTFNYTISDGQTISSASVEVFVEFLRPTFLPIDFIPPLVSLPQPNDTVNRFQKTETESVLVGSRESDEIVGSDADDLLFGLSGNDNIFGLEGEDRIYGNEGDDFLVGDDGNDRLFGGVGDDALFGDTGNDLLVGGPGNDFILGGQGNDFLLGEVGDDYLEGNRGNDTIYGGEGNDFARGNLGDDLILGNEGNDTLSGDEGNDCLWGGAGDDFLVGGVGDDTLVGGEGNNTLLGGAGNDSLVGGSGNDILEGGAGSDTFFLAGDQGIDTIFGFNPDVDVLMFADGLSLENLERVQLAQGVLLKQPSEENGFVHLFGISVNDLNPSA